MTKHSISQYTGEITGYVKSYAALHVRLAKLELAERLSKITASLTVLMLTFTMVLFILLITSVGIAIYLGDVWQSYTSGFLAVAGFYVLVVMLLIVFRRGLVVNPLLTHIINQMMEEDDD